MYPTHILIMAAGKGTRLKSSLPKVLHPLAGRPLIEHLLQTVEALNPRHTLVVVGHQAALVKSRLRHRAVEFVDQVPQLGTGHAVQAARDWWSGKPGNLLILSGDVPLISAGTLRKMVQVHDRTRASLTLLSTRLADPGGYGRVIRAEDGRVRGIVEQKEAGPSELQVKEVNTGLYCFRIPDLSEVIDRLTADNRQKEYYLTDCVGLLSRRGKAVEAVVCHDWLEVTGVNSPVDLARMEKALRERRSGSRETRAPAFIDPESV
ncbi:MAG: NTP transferase domain-containing protein [Acidobacteria bacterium]|nr:NTP transferase domain-containing protein [Acidobacteriota bacterium]